MGAPVKSNLVRIARPDPIYGMVGELVANHYPDLAECSVLCVWRYGCKPDADGCLFEASARKANAVERQAEDGYDVVITINYSLWKESSERARRYYLDQRLASVAVRKDKDGEDCVDEDGRIQYRIRKPEFGGFFGVLRRHGLAVPGNHQLASVVQAIFDRGERSEFEAGGDRSEELRHGDNGRRVRPRCIVHAS